MFDLAIIGAGPAGYVAAERAGQNGLKVVLFDKRKLGGVCLNEGCIPTKTLLYTAKLYDNAKHGDKYGIMCNNVTYDFVKIMDRKNRVITRLVGGISAALKKYKVELVLSEAMIEGRTKEGIEITAGGQSYECKNLLIATGSEAFVPPIKGLERDRIFTNREILDIKEMPKSLTIIGGGVIGMEFANFFTCMEIPVTVIEMMDEILLGTDREISAMLRQELTKKGVVFHLGSKVTEIKETEVFFEKDGKTFSVNNEKILVSVGRRPVTSGFGLEKLEIETIKGSIKIDSSCRTNLPNVYAAGDVKGYSLLAHTASREGEVVINHILGRKDIMRYDAIPGVVYTNPEISSVGLTEEAAKKQNIAYKVRTLPMAFSGRFLAENEGKNGLCKILTGEKYGEVLGVHMIGNSSSEIIYGASIMIESQLRIKDIQQVVFPHPTVSEIVRETLFAFNE
jgi:dihydrolipoamide dehydrogenase